jgi:putative FmdB family regulatory protein
MPIYEYRCTKCGAKTSVLVRSYGASEPPACAKCGHKETTRIFSAFAYHRSEADRMGDFDTNGTGGMGSFNDSRDIGMWAKKRAREMGLDAKTTRGLDTVVDRAREKALSGELFDSGSPSE